MSSTDRGKRAERAAGDYLEKHRFKIIEYNWRTRFCEIDIVAQKDNVLYFAEVKYRASSRQGSGLDYITPKKLQQMQFAAELWVSTNNWAGEYVLSAIAVTGSDYVVESFLADLSV